MVLIEDYKGYVRVPFYDDEHPVKPFELCHVYDMDKRGYVNMESHCCYYSPIDLTGYSWSSSDESVLTVDSSGVVETVGRGSARIDWVDSGGESACFNIIVFKDVPPKSFKKGYIPLKLGLLVPIEELFKHGHCTHLDNCLFGLKCWDLVNVNNRIREVRKYIGELGVVLEDYRNGIIVYHDLLDGYYDVRVVKSVDVGGGVRHSVSVDVCDGFEGRVRDRIRELELELRLLVRERSRE